MKRLAVIGGGAAGFFTAINAKIMSQDLDVTIFEATPRVLTKVKISGGGRCNVTHNLFEPKALSENYPRGKRELIGPFHGFQPSDTVKWFSERGLNLKAEADGRMFPESNRSSSVIDVFTSEVDKLGISVRTKTLVKGIEPIKHQEGSPVFRLDLRSHPSESFDFVVIATGSAPFGYDLLKKLQHRFVETVPSLFTFEVGDDLFTGLPGTSFENATLNLKVGGKQFKQKAPLLFTHWGLSGPSVLKLSAFAARELKEADYNARLSINFTELSTEEALTNISKVRESEGNKSIKRSPLFGTSKRFWESLCSQIWKSDMVWSAASKKDLRRLSEKLTRYDVQVEGKGVFKDEFVSAGGADLRDINFKTMESKLHKGLFVVGEVLNIDGITGGFNFQNAWTGGWLCAQRLRVLAGSEL